MSNDIMYSTTATSWGGRKGRAVTNDDRLDLDLSVPAEMGGDGGEGTNPEQLFALGWSACFHSALKGAARQQKVDVSESAVSATIGVRSFDAGGGLTARIEVEVPGLERDVAQELVDQAHQMCPYSRATRGNIDVDVQLVQGE
ncbi:MAG TPA: organic hydroperoxide resistance protein [Beutenbergiaceae bacterium]|nr:organic hydroperoxide resistance protein [Beutenbergiaceae bacterium]